MLILSECEVELVRQRCVHQFGGLALILIGVLESGINHTDGALMAFKVEPLHYRDRVLESGINHTDGALMAFKVEPLHYRDRDISFN